MEAARLPSWITRDLAAVRNAIDPNIRADQVRDPGIIEAQVPRSEFDALLAASERAYSGFNGALPGSSEIVIRTPEQAALFNRYIVR